MRISTAGERDGQRNDPGPNALVQCRLVALSDRVSRGLTPSLWSSAGQLCPGSARSSRTTPERGLLAETEGRPALTDASGKKRRKLKQSLCFHTLITTSFSLLVLPEPPTWNLLLVVKRVPYELQL